MAAAASSSGTTSGLGSFLAAAKAKTTILTGLHVSLGNEAGDADSLVSAICHSYLKGSLTQAACVTTDAAMNDVAAAVDSAAFSHVPVLSIPRGDFKLRPETSELMTLAGVATNDLVFLDEVDLKALARAGHLRLSLTDHNQLAPKLIEDLGDTVVEIVDHHLDVGAHTAVEGVQRNVAFDAGTKKALVGSACTLVAEAVVLEAPQLLDSTLATLLGGVILIDTINMDAAAAKGTARDGAVLETLEPMFPLERSELFQRLVAAKFSSEWWGSLSVSECLRYDYKQGESGGKIFGISAILLPIGEVTSKAGFTEAASAFIEERGLDVLVLMTFVMKPEPQRQLLVVANNPGEVTELTSALEGSGAMAALELEPLATEEVTAVVGELGGAVFHQRKTSSSRKQVMPMITEALAS